ncbi:hypothetical protein PTTG_11209 [Puccinia triticina 1-1 BBBD Race 1]|uniref:Uncharacterized protein n=1 Tax=Puccinia triticina (isolate 1-1 / race 1 (BBBD)) TaxID=630390 RepID=A0A0C4FDA4_PUCT1|nr:hypothetical protein PTTG_11209 [Puccinia triticina 1-1 BBBD Race 1]
MLRTSILPFPDQSESQRRRLLVCRIAQQNRKTVQQILDSDLDNKLDSSDSDEETRAPPKKKRQPNKDQDHLKHHKSMMNDYFNEFTRYNSRDFCQRFRMERGLVVRIIQDLTKHYPYFVQKAVNLSISIPKQQTLILSFLDRIAQERWD